MRTYDPTRMLVSVHVPKCGGTSLTSWLGTVFPQRLHLHYPGVGPPERLRHKAGRCVHGHFYHHEWDISVNKYYPDCTQFITVLRNPLHLMISTYRYQCVIGHAPAGDIRTYLENVLNWPQFFAYLNLPFNVASPDAWSWVERYFVWIGVLDHLDMTLPVLAHRLGASSCPTLAHLNSTCSSENTVLDTREWDQRFRKAFPDEYALYDKTYAFSRAMRTKFSPGEVR